MGKPSHSYNKSYLAQLLKSRCTINHKTKCWEWNNTKPRKDGKTTYGGLKMPDKFRSVHRLSAYVWLNFNIESKLHICHKCDNGVCIYPKHLFPGTRSDNMQDSIKKKRWNIKQRQKSATGSKNPNSILTEHKVKKIKKLFGKFTTYKIGDMFDVSRSTINNIKIGKNWTHVK